MVAIRCYAVHIAADVPVPLSRTFLRAAARSAAADDVLCVCAQPAQLMFHASAIITPACACRRCRHCAIARQNRHGKCAKTKAHAVKIPLVHVRHARLYFSPPRSAARGSERQRRGTRKERTVRYQRTPDISSRFLIDRSNRPIRERAGIERYSQKARGSAPEDDAER